MGNLISQMKLTAEGPRVRMWEVPDDYEVVPGPDWEEQPAPGLPALAGLTYPEPGWRPPWQTR